MTLEKYIFCFQGKCSEQEKLLKTTHTLYVGNLSFYTTEEQVLCLSGQYFLSSLQLIDEFIVMFTTATSLRCFFFSLICCLFLTWIQVHELFSKSGDVKRIIIGLDKVKKTACGFCFVEYPLIHFLYIWHI